MRDCACGLPFSKTGFGDVIADAIGGAGLSARSEADGLRTAAARGLAEAVSSGGEIAAIHELRPILLGKNALLFFKAFQNRRPNARRLLARCPTKAMVRRV